MKVETITPDSLYYESCRLCLAPEQDVSLDSLYQNSITYGEVVLNVVNVQIVQNDNYPDKICVECASKLVLFYKFRKKCDQSQNILASAFPNQEVEQPLKEIPEHYDVCKETADEINQPLKDNDLQEEQIDSIEPIQCTLEEEPDVEECNVDMEVLEIDEECGESFIYIEDEVDYRKVEEFDGNSEIDETTEYIVESLENPYEDLTETLDGTENAVEGDQQNNLHTKKGRKKNTEHPCNECGKIFTRKCMLEQHYVTHSGIKLYSCEICNNHFTRKAHLNIHMRIHLNIKPYVCELCDRGFTKSSDLARHKRVHSDERNYSCPECDKKFKRSTDVSSHMRSHSGDRPYACNLCSDKSYSSHSSLKKHQRLHHKLHFSIT